MTRDLDRNPCARSEHLVQNRMFEAVLGLGGRIRGSGLSRQQFRALRKSAQGSTPEVLCYMLSLDVMYVEATGVDVNPCLKSAAKKILDKNSKGGESNGSRHS